MPPKLMFAECFNYWVHLRMLLRRGWSGL